jgi:hypothetical protein
MISERTFAEGCTSFWHQCLPMGEEVIQAINNRLQQRFAEGRRWDPDREIREDLVSEIGLRWFSARVIRGRLSDREPAQEKLDRLAAEANAFVRRLRGSPVPELPPPSATELSEAAALARGLAGFVGDHAEKKKIVPRPSFDGCGLLSACTGDLLIGHTLYEVKDVKRGFHQPDLRQLVTYCALNSASPRYDIRRVGLVNPKRGTYFHSDLEWLIRNLSGQGSADLFSEILDFVATERVSV